VKGARVEPSVASDPPGTRYQFERLGYFVTDEVDSRPDALVYNRIVTLRDTWAKRVARTAGVEAAAGKPAAAAKPRAAGGVERDVAEAERRRSPARPAVRTRPPELEARAEERRVGKEWRPRGAAEQSETRDGKWQAA